MAKGKRIPGLDYSGPAAKMIQVVLRTQLKAMCSLREKAFDDDPSGVHDMRVVSRRLRSALSDFKPFLHKPSFKVTKLRAIAKGLGAVRDEDVALAGLAELQSKATGDAAEGIELLAAEHRTRRIEARLALEKAIKRSAVAEFRREFESTLTAATTVTKKKASQTDTTGATLTFGQVGVEVIKARLKELRDASPRIYAPLEIRELHELRILAKRLRYAIEVFGQCGVQLGDIAREISYLQTSLGELHDCDVWIESLGTRLKQFARKDRNEPDNLHKREGAIWVIRYFVRERMEHYRDALDRWQQWEAEGFLDRLSATIESVAPLPRPENSLAVKSLLTGS